jgi:hypothetical protein
MIAFQTRRESVYFADVSKRFIAFLSNFQLISRIFSCFVKTLHLKQLIPATPLFSKPVSPAGGLMIDYHDHSFTFAYMTPVPREFASVPYTATMQPLTWCLAAFISNTPTMMIVKETFTYPNELFR